jgi:AbrB family looped-hinge helix DNA binding protein
MIDVQRRISMEIVTVSPKYQVVIPLALRKSLKIRAGQRVELREHNGVLQLVPIRSIAQLRGIVRDLENDFEREPDREF